MTTREAQQQVDEWINSTGVRYFNELASFHSAQTTSLLA